METMIAASGVYFVPEVSAYLRATGPRDSLPSYRVLLRWVTTGLPSPGAAFRPRRERRLSFEDLVSLRMIVALRQSGFSSQHIRRVHEWSVRNLGYPKPFALHDLWVGRGDIFFDIERQLISVSRRGQFGLDIIRSWLERLPRFDAADLAFDRRVNCWRVASKWQPHPWVVLDPEIQFGAPCVAKTRIPTRTIWSMSRGGDRPEAIARAYRIPEEGVQRSLEWEDKLERARAG
ncbi:MAG: DUF433 domain-containing protein [Chloroflexi bacterium]|nr:DUF433 domain-containing protein [Chloroflexota bacterium]